MADADYAPIIEALRGELEAGVRRINFWDGYHYSPENREIFSNPELLALVQEYGNPKFAIELVPSDFMNAALDRYVNGTDEQREQVRMALNTIGDSYHPDNASKAEQYNASIIRIFDNIRESEGGVEGYFPDPRTFMGLTAEEARVFGEVMGEMGEVPEHCVSEYIDKKQRSFSPEEGELYESASSKFSEMAYGNKLDGGNEEDMDTSEIDREISHRVTQRYGEGDGNIVVTMYGLLHFAKQEDLDEWLPGVSVALFPGVDGIHREIYSKKPDLYNDLPDYVWYADQKRLVKLDSPEKIAEFLGVDSTVPGEQQPVFELTEEQRRECEFATAHLLPYQAEIGEQEDGFSPLNGDVSRDKPLQR